MNKEMIIVLDFGGQYNQLIARRVRECNVYAEVHPYTLSLDKIKEMNPKGIIFTGGPNSVYGEESPRYQKEIFDLGIPILGICYGSQLMAYMLGGTVETAPVSEYGRTEVDVDNSSAIFQGVKPQTICWMRYRWAIRWKSGATETFWKPILHSWDWCIGSRSSVSDARKTVLCKNKEKAGTRREDSRLLRLLYESEQYV